MDRANGRGMRTIFWAVFCMASFFYGMYYEFCGTIACIVMAGLLLWKIRQERKMKLELNVGMSLALLMAAGYLVSCIWAVDTGMAFTGVFRILWIVVFLMGVQQFEPEYRGELIGSIPYIGALQCLIGFVGYFVPFMQDHLYVNHRFGGFFQYPNTCAIFLLAGIIIVCEKKMKIWDYLVLAVLTAGIVLTASRTVFVLTVIVYIILLIKEKNLALVIEVALFAVVSGIAIFVNGDMDSIGRITSVSFTDSTFVGRLLYAVDASGLLARHPFGLGYLGYYYMENEIQTGVYAVRYVHNDLLQIGLDIGWIPMMAYVAGFVRSLISRDMGMRNKLVLAVLFVHGLFDFDSSYTVIMAIILLLMQDASWKHFPDKYREVQISKAGVVAASGVLAAVSIYMSVPLLLAYCDKTDLAVSWYPCYTDEQLVQLSEIEDTGEANALADKILKQNDTCALACKAKATVAYYNDDYDEVMRWQKKVIDRDYYNYNNYLEYAYMLYDGAALLQDDDPEKAISYMEEIRRIPEYLSQAEAKLSKLGKMIDDQPELAVDESLQEILNAVGAE